MAKNSNGDDGGDGNVQYPQTKRLKFHNIIFAYGLT